MHAAPVGYPEPVTGNRMSSSIHIEDVTVAFPLGARTTHAGDFTESDALHLALVVLGVAVEAVDHGDQRAVLRALQQPQRDDVVREAPDPHGGRARRRPLPRAEPSSPLRLGTRQ